MPSAKHARHLRLEFCQIYVGFWGADVGGYIERTKYNVKSCIASVDIVECDQVSTCTDRNGLLLGSMRCEPEVVASNALAAAFQRRLD